LQDKKRQAGGVKTVKIGKTDKRWDRKVFGFDGFTGFDALNATRVQSSALSAFNRRGLGLNCPL